MNPDGINLTAYREALEKMGERADIDLFIQKMNYLNLRNSVYIDCTADAVCGINLQTCSQFLCIGRHRQQISLFIGILALPGTEEDRKGKECEIHV